MSYDTKKRYSILIFVMAVFLVSAVAGLTAPKKQIDDKKVLMDKESMMQMPTFTLKNNGEEYYLRKGEPFRLILPENPTTGYRWIVAQATSPRIVLLREDYLPQIEGSTRMGAGGIRNMIFETTEKGRVELTIYLRRPWEPEEEYVDFYNLCFEVK